jgi:hypothetical protein
MDLSCSVQITDRDGWLKTFTLEKSLVHIGSEARNDIVLDAQRGAGVVPRHLQLVTLPGQGYRAVNLSTVSIPLGESGTEFLEPRSALQVTNGVRLQLGEFVLVFRLGEPCIDVGPEPAARPVFAMSSARVRTSAVIGLQLSLPDQALVPERSLEGFITVRNQGKEPGVQFRLELEGLDPGYYEMGPGPILFPNVEKAVSLRLNHPRGPNPPAGRHTIQVRVTAPTAYPGESAIVSREIEIRPYFSHAISLLEMD